MFCTQHVGTVERDRGDQQRRPDEAFALLHLVRAPGHHQHRDHGCQIRQGREPAGLDHVHLCALLENRRQPQDKTVHADAPAEELQGQQDHSGGTERRSVVFHRLEAHLLGVQCALQVLLLLMAQPLGFAWAVIGQAPPDKGPEYCWQALDDKHPAPAVMLHQITRYHRHPQHGHRVAEDQEGVGA